MPVDVRKLIPVSEFADQYGLSRTTVRWAARHGKIDSTKAGPIWLIDPQSARRYFGITGRAR